MMRSFPVLAICLTACGLVGCGQQATDTSAAHSSKADPQAADVNSPTVATEDGVAIGAVPRRQLADEPLPVGLTKSTGPDEIVVAFLNALRRGDSGVAEALLTRRAREETRKHGLSARPLGSPNAAFSVGVPEYLDAKKNGAHVNTTWTEQQGTSNIHYDIIWALRRHDMGWRVAGMGAQLGPGQPVVYLNFEKPDEMLAKWRDADDAVAAAQAPDSEIRQAQTPQAPTTSYR